jgi:hypothetical protein
MGENKEPTETELALEKINQLRKISAEKCKAEIDEVLKKHNFRMSVSAKIEDDKLEAGINLIPNW